MRRWFNLSKHVRVVLAGEQAMLICLPFLTVLLAHLKSNLEDQSKVLQPLLPASHSDPMFIQHSVQRQRSISLWVGIYS